jgi:hypothetical protein
MRGILIIVAMVALTAASILPSYGRRGPAFPTEANRGPAFPKSVSPTDRNETNWVTGPRVYTPRPLSTMAGIRPPVGATLRMAWVAALAMVTSHWGEQFGVNT